MIIGHKNIIDQLKQLADDKFLSHSYIFWGLPKVGKKTIAKALANYLENQIFDYPEKILLDSFEIDVLNNNEESALEQIRMIKDFLYKTPIKSFYRTVIVDNASSLNKYAQNACLKLQKNPLNHH